MYFTEMDHVSFYLAPDGRAMWDPHPWSLVVFPGLTEAEERLGLLRSEYNATSAEAYYNCDQERRLHLWDEMDRIQKLIHEADEIMYGIRNNLQDLDRHRRTFDPVMRELRAHGGRKMPWERRGAAVRAWYALREARRVACSK